MVGYLWSDFDIFLRVLLRHDLVSPTLVLSGVMHQPMLLQRVLDLFSSREWLLRSLKPIMARMFVGVAFLYCRLSAIFNLRKMVYNLKEASMIFKVIYFLLVILCLVVIPL